MIGRTRSPDGWTATTLGQIGEYINGRGFKKSEWAQEGRPIIRIQNLTGTTRATNYYPGEVDERHVACAGDLLVSWAASLGAYIWQGPEACVNQHIFKVESKIDRRFHYYLLQNSLAKLQRQTHGSGMVHITRKRFDSTPVAIPDRETQGRIASKIDELFSDLDAGVAALDRARAKLARCRAAVLKAAVEGMLTAQWRIANSSHEPSQGIIDSIVQRRSVTWGARGAYAEVFAPKGSPVVPGSWSVASIDGLLREPLRNGRSAKPPSDGKGIRILTLTAVTEDDFSERNTKLAAVASADAESLWLEPGDILVERSNTPDLVGTAAIFRGTTRYSIYPDLLIRIRVDQTVNNEYVALALRAPATRRYFKGRAKGIASSMPKVDHETVRACPIPLPPRPEQDRIVAAVREMFDAADRISDEINTELERTAALKRSLLSAAFSGRLDA